MKKILCFAIFVFLSGTALGSAQPGEVGTLTFLVGEAFVKRAGQDWCNAEFDMALYTGDKIKTGADSRCEIALITGSVIRMDEHSIQDLEKISVEKKAKEVSLFVGAGRLWLNARKIVSKHDSFKVRTDKTVCAIRGTRLGLDTNKSISRIAVYEGEVEVRGWRQRLGQVNSEGGIKEPVPVKGPHPVTMKEWVEIIRALQQITVDAQGGYYKSDLEPEADSRDPWIIWNKERDRLVPRLETPHR
jgi:hypothetical protein